MTAARSFDRLRPVVVFSVLVTATLTALLLVSPMVASADGSSPALGTAATHPGFQSLPDGVTVQLEPADVSVDLGQTIDLRATITNRTAEPIPDLVVHLDILDPSRESSVDPEDWTATLSQSVGSLEPGASKTVTWAIQPISPGSFVAYLVALTPSADDVTPSNVLTIEVADRRSLNPQGVLPLSLAMPAAIGVLLATRLRRGQ